MALFHPLLRLKDLFWKNMSHSCQPKLRAYRAYRRLS